jgi:hypothetical protein
MMRVWAIALLATASAGAQVTYLGVIGAGQTVPDPVFTGSGVARLSGFYCPATGLEFAVSGLPLGYNTGPAVTQEQIWYVFAAGPATLPGVVVADGLFYVPLTNPVTLGGGASSYIGPGDIISCPGLIPLPGPAAPYVPNGSRFSLGAIPPGNYGILSMQAFLFDPALSRVFTTNAINFSIP